MADGDEVDIVAFGTFAVANIVSTGALNSGSITSGFGNIDTGSSTITTTGAVTTGALSAKGGAVFNEDSADVDFRVESNGNANMLVVDGGNDSVLMGGTETVVYADTSGNQLEYATYFALKRETANSSQAVAYINNTGADGTIIDLRKDGTTIGTIGNAGSRLFVNNGDVGLNFAGDADQILPSSAGTNRDAAIDLGTTNVRFKDLYLSSGVFLGGTGSANELTDKEEGTWTAVAADGDGNLGTSDSRGKYVKIGSLVYVSFLLPNINTTGMSSSAKFEVRGLPFTVNDSNYGMGSMFFSHINLSTATNVTLTPAAEVGTTRIRFFESSDNGAFNEITANYIADDTADIHACSISYFTNS